MCYVAVVYEVSLKQQGEKRCFLWVGYFYLPRKNMSDKICVGNKVGPDNFQNGLDIIRYPTTILSPAGELKKDILSNNFQNTLLVLQTLMNP